MKKLLALAGSLVLGSSVSAAAPTGSAPSFDLARSYATGHAPESVAIGDMNGDGKLDLATANAFDMTVSVLLNRGDGRLQVKLDYQTGDWPLSVAIGDLNSDGKLDLATANFNANTVSVLLNIGEAGFQPRRDYATGDIPDSAPRSVALGDLNGDGMPDLVTANGGADTVAVLLNRGDGSFRAKVDYRTGRDPASVAISDLNGDGKLDLATANGSTTNTVSVLLNRGDGSFPVRRDYRTGLLPKSYSTSVGIGDLNGDGKPDLVTANGGADTVAVLLNRGDGSFRAKVDYRTGRDPALVAIGDLNGDRRPDLVTANRSVSVLANNGDGSFQAKRDYATGRAFRVAIGDLNDDGKADLATANGGGANSVSVLINTPGLCTVQDIKRQRLPTAKRTLARANCRVGKIRRAYSKTVRRRRVISQKPKFGAVLRGGGKVNLVVSRGRRS